MRFVSVSELKNNTSAVVREATKGRSIIVMRHGRPRAALIRVSAEDLDQFLFEDSPLVKRALREALADKRRGRYVSLQAYRRGQRSR